MDKQCCKVCRMGFANFRRPEEITYIKEHGICPPFIRPTCSAARYIVEELTSLSVWHKVKRVWSG